MKKIVGLFLLSTSVYATDYTNPIVDISNTRKFPPMHIEVDDYQWPNTINDVPGYKEPVPVYITREKCKFGMGIIGGCKTRADYPAVNHAVKLKPSNKKLPPADKRRYKHP